MKRLGEILNQKETIRILDVATGSGQFIGMIQGLCNNYSEIIGIDTSETALDRAQDLFGDSRVKFIRNDIHNLDEMGVFDVICLSNSLHHFHDVHALFSVMEKKLKSDGFIIVQEMYSNHLEEKQQTHVGFHHYWAEIDRLSGVVHHETFEREEILKLLSQQNNLKVTESWVKQYEEDEIISHDDIIMLKSSLKKYLERTKDYQEHEKFVTLSLELEQQLDDIGFELASQLFVVLKKT